MSCITCHAVHIVKTMALAHSVTETVQIKENTVLCFFVDGTGCKEWTYALTLEPLGPNVKFGADGKESCEMFQY